jgi:hypothetical protein
MQGSIGKGNQKKRIEETFRTSVAEQQSRRILTRIQPSIDPSGQIARRPGRISSPIGQNIQVWQRVQ